MPVSKDSVIIVDREFKPENAEDVFYVYKALIIESLRNNLIKADKDQPGKLIQSIDVNIYEKGGKLTFELEMEDYWKYVDEGRKRGSKMPPLDAMLDFIKVRGLKYKAPNKKQVQAKNKKIRKALKQINADKGRKTLAFLIGRSIKRKGIKPTHFFTDVINDELKMKLTNDLAKALQRDIEIDFKESIK